jgi:eukaryotic-like serine/threonine-protein kinase
VTPEGADHLGSYRLVRKIGEGGMGAVYLAEHTLLGRNAAIKILHDRYTGRDELVERFFNEARAASAIVDPGIVQVFDFGQEDDRAYIVMELLEGEGLDARLARLGKLPAVDVLRLTRQLALSLHAAHERGVIHRDLKPENVFIVKDAEAAGGERTKILDFGIAKLTADQTVVKTQTGLMMGSPHYMSPEQCRGAGSVDHRADIYSLGCVMFLLLTGRTVFEAEGTGDLVVAHITQTPQLPSELVPVSRGVDEIVARCLAKLPDDRFASMHALAVAVDALPRLDGLTPIPARSPVAALDLDPPRPSRRLWYGVAALLVAGAAVVTAVVLKGTDDREPAPIAQPASPPTHAAPPSPPPAVVVAPPPAAVVAPSPTVVVSPPAPASVAAPPPAIAKRPHGQTIVKPPPPAPTVPPVVAPPVDPYADR